MLPNADGGCRTVDGVRWFTGPMDDDAPLTVSGLGERVEAVSALYARKFGVERDADWFMLKLAEEVGGADAGVPRRDRTHPPARGRTTVRSRP